MVRPGLAALLSAVTGMSDKKPFQGVAIRPRGHLHPVHTPGQKGGRGR